MPILQPSANACIPTYPTAQNVVGSAAADLLNRVAPEDPVLLDYINRVQLQLLRVSRWKFLQSPLQQFITKQGRTDYWIGPVGQAPQGVVDTGLNITNLGPIKTDTFYDRSNFHLLKRTNEQILSGSLAYRDDTSRLGIPRMYRNAPDTPCVVNIYPAPDNQNIYQPTPEPPAVSSLPDPANTLGNRIYFVRTTFVDSLGNESNASVEQQVFIPNGYDLVVQPPTEPVGSAIGVLYNQWNLYIFNAGTFNNLSQPGGETLANPTPLATSTPYQEPSTGFLTGGISYPTANTLTPLQGYVMEFRYFQAKPQVQNLLTQLLIPSDYFDVLVAGVNYFTAQFLKDESAQMYWEKEYQTGIIGMIRDKNLFPNGPAFMAPDPTSQQLMAYYGYETIDQANFPFSTG